MKKISMRKIQAIRTKPGQATPQFNTTSTSNSSLRSRRLEVVGTKKQRAREKETREGRGLACLPRRLLEQRLFHHKLKFKMAFTRDGFHRDFAAYLKYCRIFVRVHQKVS